MPRRGRRGVGLLLGRRGSPGRYPPSGRANPPLAPPHIAKCSEIMSKKLKLFEGLFSRHGRTKGSIVTTLASQTFHFGFHFGALFGFGYKSEN